MISGVYIFLDRHSYSCADFNGKPLPSLIDYWGKHCALITGVEKPSRIGQLKPYLTLPYPTQPYPTPPHPTPPYPTLPYPTLHLPYPTLPYPALPLPYPYPSQQTLPHTPPLPDSTPIQALPNHTLPYKHGKPSF